MYWFNRSRVSVCLDLEGGCRRREGGRRMGVAGGDLNVGGRVRVRARVRVVGMAVSRCACGRVLTWWRTACVRWAGKR